jgi:stage III sporulation protein AB
MPKLFGITVILISSALLGIYQSKKEERRIKALTDIKLALVIIRSQINYSLSTLSQAVLCASERLSGSVSGVCSLFKRFYQKLCEKNGKELSVLWEEAIYESITSISIKPEDIHRLALLSKTFSSQDKQLCLNGIDAFTDYIDRKIEELGIESQKSKRLYPSLCLLSGAMLVIFLI